MIEVIAEIPEKTGVYFFLNDTGKILYIGKAINLKKRITDHFRKTASKIFIKVKKDREFRKSIIPDVWDFQQKQIEGTPSFRQRFFQDSTMKETSKEPEEVKKLKSNELDELIDVY